jgi:uncharacterized protein (DUF4415 family)
MDNTSKTDWEALKKMTDSDIDYSDIATLDESFFKKAIVRIPAEQAKSLVKLDPDVLAWFEAQGLQGSALINSVLRDHIATH